MFTPRQPVRRRLVFSTPARSVKRFRRFGPVATRAYRSNFKHVTQRVKTSGTLTQQVKSLQRAVKKLAPETKYFDVSLNQTNITVNGAITHITGIAQGDTLTSRTGNSINVTNVTCKGTWVRNSDTSSGAGFNYRILVVVDTQQVADTNPAPSDVISDAGFTANPIMCLPNTANLERFRILYTSPLYEGSRGAVTNTAVFNQTSILEFSKALNLKVAFNGITGADIQKNGIFVVFLTDSTNNVVDFSGIARIAYNDV